MRAGTLRTTAVCAFWLAGFLTGVGIAKGDAREVLRKGRLRRGICVVLGDRKCELAVGLARGSELTVLVQLTDAAQVQAACRAADAAGFYGRRIFVAKGAADRIGLADNVADVVVAPKGPAAVPKAEVLRVLRPGGKALLGDEEVVKPPAKGADDWTHHYHGPDNNPQSNDTLARGPYLTQFVAQPRYGPAPQAGFAAGGRVFMAFGHVAWHEREEPWMDTLVALNGYNGTLLWKHALSKGIMVDRCTMVATPSTLYVGDPNSCKLLDAATGEVIGEITAPKALAGGTFWKWMGLEDGVLYALIGKHEKPDAPARWRRRQHGWPWGGISNGYNAPEYTWGFGGTLLAIDPKTKRVLWHHRESAAPMDSRGTCMKAGRIFVTSFGRYIACLDAKTGNELWRKTPDGDSQLFEALGKFSPGHGYRTGWKSTVYVRCTDKALYFMGPQLRKLTAVSAKDGRLLWSLPLKSNINVHVVIRPDGLYAIGGQNVKDETWKLDPMTGEVLAKYDVWRRACTRATGTPDAILFRASGGTGRLDLATGKPQWISPMRSSCHVGVLVANGHLYYQPWVCDCNLQMFGAICTGPAGDFKFDANATEAERLEAPAAERRPEGPKKPKPPARRRWRAPEWATYLGNNQRAAQTGWGGLNVPDETAQAWRARTGPAVGPTAPVVTGGRAYLAGRDGTVRALRLSDGTEAWRAYTGGAIYYPPSIAGGTAFVGSADGWVYAFDAANGKLRWRFRAAPAERRIPVYGRLQSTWPVASGVLVEGGVAYFAAGMMDYDGTYVYALDAGTGRIKWQNNTSGHLDAFSRRGIAVQGHLLANNGKLYLAGGNAVSPGVYDMKTGKCETAAPTGFGTRARRGRELRLVNGHVEVSGQPLYSDPRYPVFDGSCRLNLPIVVGRNASVLFVPGTGPQGPTWKLVAVDGYTNGEMWSHTLPAQPVRWGIAADPAGRIVVTCRNGDVLCFAKR